MDSNILVTISAFLAPYLFEAGKTVSTETIKLLFSSRKELAEDFKNLFHTEIQTLGLSNTATTNDITKQLQSKPEMQEEIRQKVEANQDLMNRLTEALSKQEGRIIHTKTYIENASNFIIKQ